MTLNYNIKMARKLGKGQRFDKYYKVLNNYFEKNNYKYRMEHLNYLKSKLEEIKQIIPKSDYEIKDQINLIQQYNNYIVNPF